jgi:hypothetical protein
MSDRQQSKPCRPEEPDPSDCCGSGCPRCIFDIHDEAMQHYHDALREWQRQLPDKPDSGDA